MAYKDAIRNKGKNPAFVEYDLHRCRNLLRVQEGLRDHSLRSTATAYVVRKPVIREVFSADMDICVVAHWLVEFIRPVMEREMTPRVFNNRIDKGLDKALDQLATDIYERSRGFTEDCYVFMCDIQGYFPNANQDHAYCMLERLLIGNELAERDFSELIYALNLTVYFSKDRIVRKSPTHDWHLLKPGKSVLEKPEGIGAFPGEMIMQMAMTYYCDDIYKWLESMDVRFVVYGDDIAFAVKDKVQFLNYIIPEFRRRMAEIGCTIHPKKFYGQHYTKGVRFCSQFIKLQRIYIGNRTKNNYFEKVRYWNRRCKFGNIDHAISSLNSYIGIMKRRNAYGILRKGYEALSEKWKEYLYLNDATNTLKAREEYRHNRLIINRFNLYHYDKPRENRSAALA